MSGVLRSINPATDVLIKEYQIDSDSALRFKLENARSSFEKWRGVSLRQRAAYLKSLSDYLQKNKQGMAAVATQEMGKPIAQSIAEIEKSAETLAWYAEKGPSYLAGEPVESAAQKSYVSFQPLGCVLAIMPWNFPYWQVFRAMGPILMAGNSMVLKHASNVTGCALEIEKAIRETNMPENLFQVLKLPSADMEKVIAHKHIRAVTFTGSTSAGRSVAALAGQHLKKQVLELGGSDPYLVLADADLKSAVEVCVHSRLNNTGQSCIAAKRFIVDKKVVRTFEKQMVLQMEEMRFGDPMDTAMQMGPLARKDLRDTLHQQVLKSVEKGARLLCGGQIPEGKGAFYPPTVLAGVKKGMPAYDEELFGPVAAILEAEDEAHALRLANDSDYGLGAAVFSRDIKNAEKLAETGIEAGSVFVNQLVRSNVAFPFGGIKDSGYGRELSYYGIREFVNIKTIYIK